MAKERKPGPDGRVIVWTKTYDARGATAAASLPHFETGEASRYISTTRDAQGRVTATSTPSGATQSCYAAGISVHIDENGHRRRESRGGHGQIVKVEEYLGTYAGCTTEAGAPFATTTYESDPLGRLVLVTDAKGNKTAVRYDSLGRKRYVHDPGMGELAYGYDESGNLAWQQSSNLRASQRVMRFEYDLLERLTRRWTDPGGTSVEFAYDEAASTNGVGRRTWMSDDSGAVRYDYDRAGRVTRTTRSISGISDPYVMASAYDAMGRPSALTYPDGETVAYGYDVAGNLQTAGAYATFSRFNALGQPGHVLFGNGVTTEHGYYDTTHGRLKTIEVDSPFDANGPGTGIQPYLSLSYEYDPAGNISRILDALDARRTESFAYDALNRLMRAQSEQYPSKDVLYSYPTVPHSLEGTIGDRPHAVLGTSDGRVFSYDDNGNMTSDGDRMFAWDDDNRPVAITRAGVSIEFVYDGKGRRVKKIVTEGDVTTTAYVDRLYECIGSVCGKYIIAGGSRIALKAGAEVWYYHSNQLGSTRVVTAGNGTKVEEAAYEPFGDLVSDAGVVRLNHKFTGQELDPETGLYNYGARLYDPALKRFISPDTIVQSLTDPQTFNRYAYVRNNPVLYTDPTGHVFGVDDIINVIAAKLAMHTFDALAACTTGCDWKKWERDVRGDLKELDPWSSRSMMNNEMWLYRGLLHTWPWEYPQAIVGFEAATYGNLAGEVENVSSYKRATVVDWRGRWEGGITLGTYINVSDPTKTDLLQHEYGHVVQSRILGPYYLSVIGVPSLASAAAGKLGSHEHNTFWTETWANELSGINTPDFPGRDGWYWDPWAIGFTNGVSLSWRLWDAILP